MPVMMLALIGAAAGWIAARLLRLQAAPVNIIVLGIAGGLIGGVALRLLSAATQGLAVAVAALLGAVAAVWLWQRIVERR